MSSNQVQQQESSSVSGPEDGSDDPRRSQQVACTGHHSIPRVSEKSTRLGVDTVSGNTTTATQVRAPEPPASMVLEQVTTAQNAAEKRIQALTSCVLEQGDRICIDAPQHVIGAETKPPLRHEPERPRAPAAATSDASTNRSRPPDGTAVPSSSALNRFVDVQPCDVLFGRGKTHSHHPGNVRMQLLADVHRERYLQAERDDKTQILRSIVNTIKYSGKNSGRFLKLQSDKGLWAEVSDLVACRKVGHALRDGRHRRVDPAALKQISSQVVDQPNSGSVGRSLASSSADQPTSGSGGRSFEPSSVASVGLKGGGSLLGREAGGLPGQLGQQNNEDLGTLPVASSSPADHHHQRLTSQSMGTGPASMVGQGIPSLSQQQILQRQQVANQLLLLQKQVVVGLRSVGHETVQGAATTAAASTLPPRTNSLTAPTESPGDGSTRAYLLQRDLNQELAQRSITANQSESLHQLATAATLSSGGQL